MAKDLSQQSQIIYCPKCGCELQLEKEVIYKHEVYRFYDSCSSCKAKWDFKLESNGMSIVWGEAYKVTEE